MMIKKSSFIKFIICIIITLIILILIKSNSNFKNLFYDKVYNTNLSFSYINELYKSHFGSTLPFLDKLDNTNTVFNEKINYKDISIYKDGYSLELNNNIVNNIKEGIVVFIGEKEGYGSTVIVESSDVTIWYSNLSNVNVKMYDYVLNGDLIGNVDSNLYLVFIKNGEYASYKEYI